MTPDEQFLLLSSVSRSEVDYKTVAMPLQTPVGWDRSSMEPLPLNLGQDKLYAQVLWNRQWATTKRLLDCNRKCSSTRHLLFTKVQRILWIYKNDLNSHKSPSHFSVRWKVAIIALSKFESTFLKLNWKVGIFLTLALAVRQHLFLHDSFHVWQFIRLFQIVLLYFLRTATQLLPEVFEHFSLPSFWPLGFKSRWSVESKRGRGTTLLN